MTKNNKAHMCLYISCLKKVLSTKWEAISVFIKNTIYFKYCNICKLILSQQIKVNNAFFKWGGLSHMATATSHAQEDTVEQSEVSEGPSSL